MAARFKALERENRELRQANEILRKASAYCPIDLPCKRYPAGRPDEVAGAGEAGRRPDSRDLSGIGGELRRLCGAQGLAAARPGGPQSCPIHRGATDASPWIAGHGSRKPGRTTIGDKVAPCPLGQFKAADARTALSSVRREGQARRRLDRHEPPGATGSDRRLTVVEGDGVLRLGEEQPALDENADRSQNRGGEGRGNRGPARGDEGDE